MRVPIQHQICDVNENQICYFHLKNKTFRYVFNIFNVTFEFITIETLGLSDVVTKLDLISSCFLVSLPHAYLYINCIVTIITFIYVYTPPQTVFVGGYTVFTLSESPSVRPTDRPFVRNVLFP